MGSLAVHRGFRFVAEAGVKSRCLNSNSKSDAVSKQMNENCGILEYHTSTPLTVLSNPAIGFL